MGKIILSVVITLTALCTSVTSHAARPSITDLQQQINVLKAALNQQAAEISQLGIYNAQLNIRIADLEAQPKHPLVVDSNGKVLGISLGTRFENGNDINYHNVEVALFANGESFIIGISPVGQLNVGAYFTELNCSGDAYVEAVNSTYGILLPQGGVLEDWVYGPTDSSTLVSFSYSSKGFWNGIAHICVNSTDTLTGYPAAPVLDLSIFTPPFHVVFPQ